MPTAEIVTIGTELLLGITQDTNTQFLAEKLNKLGVDLFRTTTIGDNSHRISQAIQEAFNRADIVITSGGLGPTIDDPTREAVANAFQENLVFHPELWEGIRSRFEKMGRLMTENNRRQAFIPQSARAIENEVGTAPAFMLENGNKILICLPGVPAELEYIFQTAIAPLLIQKYHLHQIIFSKIIHTSGIGESQVDEVIADLEKINNPTVGLTAKAGLVDIRITVKAKDEKEANCMLQPLLEILQQKLGKHIFGYDQDTLEDKVREKIEKRGKQITLLLGAGLSLLQKTLIKLVAFDHICISAYSGEALKKEILRMSFENNTLIMGIDRIFEKDFMALQIYWFEDNNLTEEKRVFSGSPSLFGQWSINSILDSLYRKIN